jgi:hypothetical protein
MIFAYALLVWCFLNAATYTFKSSHNDVIDWPGTFYAMVWCFYTGLWFDIVCDLKG